MEILRNVKIKKKRKCVNSFLENFKRSIHYISFNQQKKKMLVIKIPEVNRPLFFESKQNPGF